jgi:hypothetical protein
MKRSSPDDALSPLRRFARPNRKGREADPAFCRHLRARAPNDPAGSGSSYWCLKTLRSEGPDGSGVSPEDCTDERACFEAAVVEGRG